MAQTNWKKKLEAFEGAVVGGRNVWSKVIQTASPSFNFTFGRGHGLPLGFTLLLGGLPKAGKTVASNMLAAGVHKDYQDAYVMKFDTEFREVGQLDAKAAAMYGIDFSRYQAVSANSPDLVFDQIEKKVGAMCADGFPLKLVIIDSLNGVQGRRDLAADSVMQQQIGDRAATLKAGLLRILPIQRKYGFSVVLTTHVTPELDPLEAKRNGKWKMGASVGCQHAAEFFCFLESSQNLADKADLLGREFIDETQKDLFGKDGKGEQTGLKIKATMKENSLGIKGRTGMFTLDYAKGVINQHEEVFLLATRRNIIERPNNTTYVFKDQKWVGKESMILALKESTELQATLLRELQERDLQGRILAYDEVQASTSTDPELAEA